MGIVLFINLSMEPTANDTFLIVSAVIGGYKGCCMIIYVAETTPFEPETS
jgi:hypothetical protein